MVKSAIGIYFSVMVREKFSLDHLAAFVAQSMHCQLFQSKERGIVGDYVGESFGMRLDLHVSLSENAVNEEGTLFIFSGGPQFEEGTDVAWINISGYVAQILTERTNLPWHTPENPS